MTPAAVRLLWDDPRGESEATWKEMAQLGWLGLSLPEAYGGSALGMVESAILLEEMGRAACPGPYFPTVLAARAIEEAGSDAQKKRWLSPIATGDARATIAFLDADLDWRPDAIQTRAETTAGGWALSGRKQFVPWAHVASVLLVPAKTPDGLTLFLVDPGATGLTLEPAQMMDPATRLASVTLEGTPVPRHGRRLREGARAVRAADRLLPGDPSQVRRDAPGGRELARGRLLCRVGARREGRGQRPRGVGRQGVRRRRRAPCLRRGDPGARRYRVHLGVRSAPLRQAGE